MTARVRSGRWERVTLGHCLGFIRGKDCLFVFIIIIIIIIIIIKDDHVRWVISHPGWQLSLDSGHVAGRALILAVQKVYGRLEASLLGFSGVFPACVDHHTAHQQTGADSVITCQVDGQQSPQTFAKGPEDSDGADSLWLRSFCLRSGL